ncbi:MAG TPA: PAS domain S-box protein, partial [Bacteroidales bacterium]|nr:PAS domain S-box protein [Bacteroidales bacterium]
LAYEKSIKEREERFHTLAESVPAGIIVADKEQKTHYINNYFVKLFGYEKEEIPDVDTWMPKAYPDKEKRQAIIKQWNSTIERAHSTNSEMEPLEEEVTCKNGKKRHIEFRMKSGDLFDFILLTDISSRKKTEKRLKKR